MPVHISDEGLDLNGNMEFKKKATATAKAPSSPLAVASVAVAMSADSQKTAGDVLRSVTEPMKDSPMKDKGNGENQDGGLAASEEGGTDGLNALMRLLVKRLGQAAKTAAEASPASRTPVEGDYDGTQAEAEMSASGTSAKAFDTELLSLLEGGSLDKGQLGPSMARFSAMYLFHMQRELHAAEMRPANSA